MNQLKIKWNFERIQWLIWLILWLGITIIIFNREVVELAIDKNMPRLEGATLKAMIWGQGDDLKYQEWQMMKKSGVIHLLVISGTNVMIIMNALVEIGSYFLGRKKAILLGILIVWEYTAAINWQIPIVRASLMMSWFYLAQFIGRKFNLSRALIITVLIMVLAEVRIVKDVSFWLSLLAYIGVVTAEKMNSLKKIIWINLWVWPVLSFSFEKVSIISPLSNLMVIGVSEIIIGLGMLGLWWLAIPFIRYLWTIVDWWGMVPMIGFKMNYILIAGWYLILVYWLKKRK